MEPLLSRTIAQAAPRAHRTQKPICISSSNSSSFAPLLVVQTKHRRPFSLSSPLQYPRPRASNDGKQNPSASYAQPASAVSQNITLPETQHFDRVDRESELKARQRASPWTREGSDIPPVARNRSAGAMTKGKLLTTPSRMLKFILPLTTRDVNLDRKDVEPLALLVHPQQPLSYLERLIQSELPALESGQPPKVNFRAEDSGEEDLPTRRREAQEKQEKFEESIESSEVGDAAGRALRLDTGESGPGPTNQSDKMDSALPKPDDEARNRVEDPVHPHFVRWSPSTEIGDFIRDAARGKEFAVDIENAAPIYVGVPSFKDRTYYLRMRLRKTGRRIGQLADVKKECDELAQKGAQRVAQCGFAGLISWWIGVWYLTFQTSLGWDVMEPVTYLVGLSTLIGGYTWFLYHNREVSYRSAMNFTISRRQSQLYQQRGLDLELWEGLVEEGNRLRREIKLVAEEYDVEWNEAMDEGDERVREALREERKKKQNGKEKQKEKEDDD
ncbi:hypothetical protein Q7P37_008218 [Cladosporium fusiforme]